MLKQEGPQLLPTEDLGKESWGPGHDLGSEARTTAWPRTNFWPDKTWVGRLDPELVGRVHRWQVYST